MINVGKFCAVVDACGIELDREFPGEEGSTDSRGAPEPSAYRGFLFRRRAE